jgi:hypothetical protein
MGVIGSSALGAARRVVEGCYPHQSPPGDFHLPLTPLPSFTQAGARRARHQPRDGLAGSFILPGSLSRSSR